MISSIVYTDVDEALGKLFEAVSLTPKPETVLIEESYCRVLFKDVFSEVDLPTGNSSHVDGFAVRSEDTVVASEEKPVELALAGGIGLAELPSVVLRKGQAVVVRTGSYLPDGCDAVVPKENVRTDGRIVVISKPVSKDSEVVAAGSDIRNGSVILRRGHKMMSQDVEILKVLGQMRVEVCAKPSTAIISVGSELTDDPSEVGRGKILSSHDIVVSHMVEEAGGTVTDLGIIPDDLDAISEAVGRGLKEASMVFTIGGSSVGETDLVSRAINMLGKPGVVVHGLKLQPGRVSGFGVVDGKPIFILPGLIQSTVNAFVFLAYPLIRDLLCRTRVRRDGVLYARMAQPAEFRRWQDFKKVTWARIYEGEGGLMAEAVRGESPMLNVLVRSNGYILTPPYRQRIEKGELVAVNLVPGISSLSNLGP